MSKPEVTTDGHTGLPWSRPGAVGLGHVVLNSDGWPLFVVAAPVGCEPTRYDELCDYANACVTAVNAHHALVEIVRWTAGYLQYGRDLPTDWEEQISAALALSRPLEESEG